MSISFKNLIEKLSTLDQKSGKILTNEKVVAPVLFAVGVFSTFVAPSVSDSLIKFYHHDGFRAMILILFFYILTKSVLLAIIVLIFFLSTQVAIIQKEHYTVVSEHFRGVNSDSVDEPLVIPANYLKESGVDNLQGEASDVAPDTTDQYVLYPAAQESVNRQMASGEPEVEIPHDTDVLAYSGEEPAMF